MCVFVNGRFNHLGVLEHAQVSVHAQGSGFMASAFVKLGCLMEFPLVGIDVCQEQLIVVLTPLLPLLQISQHKQWHVCRDKHSHACTHTHTYNCYVCVHIDTESNHIEGTKNYLLAGCNQTTLNTLTIGQQEIREQILFSHDISFTSLNKALFQRRTFPLFRRENSGSFCWNWPS